MSEDFEVTLRRIVREELARNQNLLATLPVPITSEAVSGAVRAEMARQKKKSRDLAVAVGVSQATIMGRLSGVYKFKPEELDRAAFFLGLTTQNLLESAALGLQFDEERPRILGAGVAPEAILKNMDPWYNPRRRTPRR